MSLTHVAQAKLDSQAACSMMISGRSSNLPNTPTQPVHLRRYRCAAFRFLFSSRKLSPPLHVANTILYWHNTTSYTPLLSIMRS